MTHFGLVAQPLRGHMDPMSALGRALQRRGHRVTVFSDDDGARFLGPELSIRRLQLDVGVPFDDRLVRHARKLGLLPTILDMAARTNALCECLPQALDEAKIDMLIVDQTEAAGALAAMARGIPYVSVACALPLNREPGLPPPYVDWSYAPDKRWLYEGGHRVTDLLMTPLSRVIRRRAESWSLPGIGRLDDTFSSRLQLLQLVAPLDFPRRSLPREARYVGPLRDLETAPFAFVDDGRPLAFCSLGTLQGFRIDLFTAFAKTLAEAGLRPVIVHGGRLPAEAVAGLPGDPIVADFLPQRAVLPYCRLAIVNGGINTVLDALAAGVPLAVVPIAYEQGATAARVAASGAGLWVKPKRVQRGLLEIVRKLLDHPGFADNARRIGVAIAEAGGSVRAAELVEASFAASARGQRPAPQT